MSITKQRTLDYVELEWGTYVERFNRLPKEEQSRRIKEMGFESFRDMLAHILAWWEEGMGIILAVVEERPFERRKYDFDTFNAEAVVKYKSCDETEFMARSEEHTSELQSRLHLVCRLLLEKKKQHTDQDRAH